MIYAEWTLNGTWDNKLFLSWDEYHGFMFNPDIELIRVKVVK